MKKTLTALLATLLGTGFAHEEPDFSKLPDVKMISRDAVVYTPDGLELDRRRIVHGTMFKIGREGKKDYYATANHLANYPVPNAKEEEDRVVVEWLSEGEELFIERGDSSIDSLILSTEAKIMSATIPVCKEQPRVGVRTYIYGYHRGHLGLSTGLIGDSDTRIMHDTYKDYYTDADALKGSSGSPHLLYQDDRFCVFGMVLGNIDNGIMSVTRDIKYTITLYDSLEAVVSSLEVFDWEDSL